MEHAGAENQSHHEEQGDSRVEDVVDYSEHLHLADSTGECQGISDEIELPDL